MALPRDGSELSGGLNMNIKDFDFNFVTLYQQKLCASLNIFPCTAYYKQYNSLNTFPWTPAQLLYTRQREFPRGSLNANMVGVLTTRLWVGLGNQSDERDKYFFYTCTTITVGNGARTPFRDSPWLNGSKPKDTTPLIFARGIFAKDMEGSESLE